MVFPCIPGIGDSVILTISRKTLPAFCLARRRFAGAPASSQDEPLSPDRFGPNIPGQVMRLFAQVRLSVMLDSTYIADMFDQRGVMGDYLLDWFISKGGKVRAPSLEKVHQKLIFDMRDTFATRICPK